MALPFEKDPRLFELREIECCALELAFRENRGSIERLKEFHEEKLLRHAQELIKKTFALGYLPDRNLDFVYQQMASAELKRMEKTDEKIPLECSHSRKDHLKALQSLIERFSEKYPEN